MPLHMQTDSMIGKFEVSAFSDTASVCLQVEHTVTEEVTGIDIVQVRLVLAAFMCMWSKLAPRLAAVLCLVPPSLLASSYARLTH